MEVLRKFEILHEFQFSIGQAVTWLIRMVKIRDAQSARNLRGRYILLDDDGDTNPIQKS